MAASASGKRARTDDDSNPNPDTRRKAVRKRAALACDECRVRKRRCDGGFPTCGGCTHRRSACVYSSEVEARAWQSNTIQSLRSRLEELEAAETASNVGLGASSPHRGDSHLPAQTQLPEGEDGGFVQGEDAVPLTQQQTPTAPPIIAEPRSFERLMKPILQAVEQPRQGASNPTPSSSKDHNTAQCTCDFLLGATEWSLPLRRVADQLVDTYFARVQRIYPILHQPTFRRRYHLLWQSGSGGETLACSGLCKTRNGCKLFAAMLQAVFALAALLGPGSPEDNAVQADTFFSRAQKLNFLDTLDDDVGLELVQLGLIMGFYLQGTDTFSKCWNITGLTIRLAQNMGLHLDLKEARLKGLVPPQVTQLEQEMRSRVWYGCVVLEREVSMSFGRKLMAPTIAANPRLPNLVDDDLLSDQPGKWNAQTDGLPSLVESFVHTARLYDIFYTLLDRTELHEPISPDRGCEAPDGGLSSIRALLELDHKVMEWREGLPSYLRYEPESTERNATDSLSTLNGYSTTRPDLTIQAQRLYLRFLNVRILILRPALDQFFGKQHKNQTEAGKRRHRRLGDAILRDAAIQCVQCAQELAIFLDAQVRSKNFIAWWYNVTYLQSCASTILIGLVCNFGDGGVLEESLPGTLEMCLQGLARYAGLSSISRKAQTVLQDCHEYLSLAGYQSCSRDAAKPGGLTDTAQNQDQNGSLGQLEHPSPQPFSTLRISPFLDCIGNMECGMGTLRSAVPVEEAPPHDLVDRDMDVQESLDGHFGDVDYGRMSSWPFVSMPPQLEHQFS